MRTWAAQRTRRVRRDIRLLLWVGGRRGDIEECAGRRDVVDELASIIDFIRSGDTLIVVKLDGWGAPRATSSTSCTHWSRRERTSGSLSPQSTRAGLWGEWS